MRENETEPDRRADTAEGGFALILTLLVLMLLTFLGLTLATQTSTEMQIATNYRWSQQAQYNAEAGIEVGKALIRTMNWTLVLPPARTATWTFAFDANGAPVYSGTAPATPTPPFERPDKQGNPSRNFENKDCDLIGGRQGYGVVLDDGGAAAPYQNITSLMGQNLAGAVTLWVRHPTQKNQDGSYQDCTSTPCGETPTGSPDDILVLTAEGVAPYVNPRNASISFIQTRAVATREMTLTRTLGTPCGTRGGQIGGGPEGSNFSPCDPITGRSWEGALGRTITETTTVQ